MVRNQSRSSAGPISTGAQGAHGKSQPKPDSAGPEHILARSPAVVDEVDRGALPAWLQEQDRTLTCYLNFLYLPGAVCLPVQLASLLLHYWKFFAVQSVSSLK